MCVLANFLKLLFIIEEKLARKGCVDKSAFVHLQTFLRKQREKIMANHKSALKRIRSSAAKKARNKYQHTTTRTFVKRLRNTTEKQEAETLFTKVASLLDKLAKRNVIHKNKASNQKSKLQKFVNSL